MAEETKDTTTTQAITPEMVNQLVEQNKALLAALAEKKETKTEDKSLVEKATQMRETQDRSKSDERALEAALQFSLQSESWLKQNEPLLPKSISDIFQAANKEKFDSAIEKDRAIKSGIIESFFSVQSNLDLLTPGLRNSLEDYLKLTKTGKQDKAQDIYNAVFEPAIEMARRIRKAEALKNGNNISDDKDKAFRDKMVKMSRKHYFGEKNA